MKGFFLANKASYPHILVQAILWAVVGSFSYIFLQSSVERLGELFEELATLSNEGDDEDGEDLNELDGIGE